MHDQRMRNKMELHFLQPSATLPWFQHTERTTQSRAGVKTPQAILNASARPLVPDLKAALIYLLAFLLKIQSCMIMTDIF